MQLDTDSDTGVGGIIIQTIKNKLTRKHLLFTQEFELLTILEL